VSYNKSAGKLLQVLNDSVVQHTPGAVTLRSKVPQIYIGHRPDHAGSEHYFKGSISCNMIFNIGLNAADIRRVKQFCFDMSKEDQEIKRGKPREEPALYIDGTASGETKQNTS
jgi:hypothetical protein